MYDEVWWCDCLWKEVSEMDKDEKALEDAAEFMNRKETKQEQEAFLQQVLFGM